MLDVDALERLWVTHTIRCWQCADFSRPCLIGETISRELLARWVKEFHHDPIQFLEEKEPKMESWRKEFTKNRMLRMQQQFGGGHSPIPQRGPDV